MSKFNTCICNGFVSLGDDFRSVAEITHLFGGSATRLPFHNSYNVPGKEGVICILLTEDGGTDKKTGGRWHNVPEFGTNQAGQCWKEILTISEYNDNAETTATRIGYELAHPLNRYVFWHESWGGCQWYKFYGAFSLDAQETRATCSTVQPHVVYRRISKSVECLKVKEVQQVFSDAEFAALIGHVVEVKLRDEVGFSADCGKTISDRVVLWPGMKLLVTGVSADGSRVICDTCDEHLLSAAKARLPKSVRNQFRKFLGFEIPRADFRLGYVEGSRLPVAGAPDKEKATMPPPSDSDGGSGGQRWAMNVNQFPADTAECAILMAL